MIDFGIIDKLIAIFFSLAILLNGYIIGKRVKTFLFPASLFCFFWFAYTFFPLVILFDVPINPISIFFIFVCTLFFSFSAFLFKWSIAFQRNQEKLKLPKRYLSNSFLVRICYSMFFVILGCLIMDLIIQGFSISDFVTNFFVSANLYMEKRYTDEIEVNVYAQLSNVLNYTLTILGGIIVGTGVLNIKKRNKLILITLIPSILITLTQSAKGTILLAIVLFYSGILVARIFKNNLELTNKKTNKVFLEVFISLFIIMFVSFMTRGLYELDGSELRSKLANLFYSYSFGHIYAFSDWFTFYLFGDAKGIYLSQYPTYGFYTFMAIFRAFGDQTIVPPGVFDEYFSYKNLFTTNIYTFFRGTVTDFGIIGSTVFFFCFGIMVNTSFYTLLSAKKPVWTIPIFAMMLGYFYTTFIISLFIWKSIFATIIVLTIILKFNNIKYKIK